MHIVNSMAANFGKYDLDVSAVGMRSISETDIKLPYTGALPVQMSASSGAYVYLNVQLAQGARLVLVAHGKGKDNLASQNARKTVFYSCPLCKISYRYAIRDLQYLMASMRQW